MLERFNEFKKEADGRVKALSSQVNTISILRVVSFLAMAVFLIIGISDKRPWLTVAGLACLLLFFGLVRIFDTRQDALRYQQAYREVMVRYEKRLDGSWKDFPDTGTEFAESSITDKEVAGDLDIFGKNSLFQYMNVAATALGRRRLAEDLSRHLADCSYQETPETIVKRQDAVRELIERDEDSFHLEALILKASVEKKKYVAAAGGQDSDEEISRKENVFSIFLVVIAVLLFLSLAGAVAGALLHAVPWSYTGVILIVQMILGMALDAGLFSRSYEAFPLLYQLTAFEPFIQALKSLDFKSELLQNITGDLNKDSSRGIRSIKRIGGWLSLRGNLLAHLLFCAVCLYNVFVYRAFLGWKKKYQNRSAQWIGDCSRAEELLSLAVMGRSHSEYVFPEILSDEKSYVLMKNMKHPLLREWEVVPNDVELDDQIRLVTGSNMSGKTTYLRTLGVNAVLAYAGCPVCAEDARLTVMRVFTSMRVVDDVSNGISTFYAEVLRIKKMMDYLKNGRPMLCLIDEIFKGTNSADRIIGAEGVLKNLCRPNVCGMVSTHDFELCDLEKKYKKISNYHFDEHFENDDLQFDYTVKTGRCRTTNALHILRMAGIDVGEDENAQ